MLYTEPALLLMNVQNDFFPGGAVPVPRVDSIVPLLNGYVEYFERRQQLIVVTRLWHPENAGYFTDRSGHWPAHCVQYTPGSRFHSGLDLPDHIIVVSGGTSAVQDSGSAFDGFDDTGECLEDLLRRYKVNTLFVGGLATDYGVRTTVLDALGRGFAVKLLLDAVQGYNHTPQAVEAALQDMMQQGAVPILLEDMA